jgi:pilus assembly protein CpaD
MLAQLCAVPALAVMLSGCYVAKDTTGSIPTDYRKRHPIAIKEGDHSVAVFIGRHRGSLNPAQRADVASFASSWKREATGGIVIDTPTGPYNGTAAREATREIRSILTASGVPPRAVAVRSYESDPYTLSPVRLNYPRMTAEAGPCGLWPHDLGPTMDRAYNSNRPYWNLGCSNQHNLAAMVENPGDLVQPRAETPLFEGRRAVSVEKYRKGEDPSGRYSDIYGKSKISDTGK